MSNLTTPSGTIIKRLRSFRFAFEGILTLIREEANARIHLLAAIIVVAASWYFKISKMEWLFVVLSIGLVIALELINTSIEHIADFIHGEHNEKIKKIKDLAAGGVLIGALTAFIIGLIIFAPKIIGLWKIG